MGILDNPFYRLLLAGVSAVCCYHHFTEHVASHTSTSGPSMYPSLPYKSATAITKNVHRLGRGIKVGDVVIAKHPNYLSHGVGKRVLGMPGDYVVLDPPESITANIQEGPTAGKMVQVPEGHCWLAGDNLPWSRDSRAYGPVPLALVNGKVLGVITWRFPLPKWTGVRNTLDPVEWEDDVYE